MKGIMSSHTFITLLLVAVLSVNESMCSMKKRRGPGCENGYIDKDVCVCDQGFEGEHCNHLICYNGGTYEGHHGHHRCNCRSGYGGLHCENDLNHPTYQLLCNPNPCYHGGHCYHDNVRYLCSCLPTYSGRRCESATVISITTTTPRPTDAPTATQAATSALPTTNLPATTQPDACQFNPCVRGMCLATIEGFYCYCPKEYTGKRCELDVSACHSSPCQNSGHCYDDGPTLYVCICPDGYTGTTCETKYTVEATDLPETSHPEGTLAVVTTIPTTTKAPELNTCNEIDLILSLASGGRIDEPTAGLCPNSTTMYQSEAIIIKHCSSPNSTKWRQGLQVTKNCNALPKYVAIAQFHRGIPTMINGVFVRCEETDSFEMLTQTCMDDFKVKKVDWPESDTFYAIEWQ